MRVTLRQDEQWPKISPEERFLEPINVTPIERETKPNIQDDQRPLDEESED